MKISWGPLSGKIHPAGYPFILIGASLSFVSFVMGASVLGLGLAFLALGIVAFFREPTRVPPENPNLILSPADGVVVGITPQAQPPFELGALGEGHWTRVSVFLSLFDAHVTRTPSAGRILGTAYHRGQFLNASLDKASDLNERQSLVLERTDGTRLVVVQVAGLIARRIVCAVQRGDGVETAQTYGIIRFGSRVDLYVPETFRVHVLRGQRMIGGETVIAEAP